MRLVKEYFRLKFLLKITPTYEQFVRLTPSITTAHLGELFDFNYPKFLAAINENLEDQTSSHHMERMRENIITQMYSICEESGEKEAIKIIDDAKNKHDDMSLSIKAWWPDTKKLKHKIIHKHTAT